MTDPDEAIRKGQRAQQILDDEVFREAIKTLRDAAFKTFKDAKPTDTDTLQDAKLRYEAIEKLVQELTHVADNGRHEKRLKDRPTSGPPVHRV